MPTLYTVSSVSAQLTDQSLQSLTMMLTIIACASLIAAFLVVGLLIQREHDTQERIARQVRRNDVAQSVQRMQASPVPLAGVLDGGAPLPAVALVRQPAIPDETPIGDIAQQPTQIIPAAEMAAIASATAAREHVPPEILEALGARWLLFMPMALPDDASN